MVFQSARVKVLASGDGQLHIYHPHDGQCVATHRLSQGKGEVIKNGGHYHDKAQLRADLE